MPIASNDFAVEGGAVSALALRQAFDVLRWLQFLHEGLIGRERGERRDVRPFIEHLRETPNAQGLRRRPDGPPTGSFNALTGKAELSPKSAARTINLQRSVLFGFY